MDISKCFLLLQNSLSDERNDLQLIVVDVLSHELVPELDSQASQNKELVTNFKPALKQSLQVLTGSTSFLTDTSSSMKRRLSWGVVGTCCTRISATMDNFDWACHHSSVIKDLGQVFGQYCAEKDLIGDGQIIATELPDEILDLSSEENSVLKYVSMYVHMYYLETSIQ